MYEVFADLHVHIGRSESEQTNKNNSSTIR